MKHNSNDNEDENDDLKDTPADCMTVLCISFVLLCVAIAGGEAIVHFIVSYFS